LLAVVSGTSLLLILTHDALTQSTYFKAQTITVEGNQKVSKEAILKQARLKRHDNILSVNLKTVRYRLLSHPWIAEADVKRQLPDTIDIRIQERVPLAILDLNKRFYLDDKGEIFKAVEASDQVKVPRVTGLQLSDIDLNNPWGPGVFRPVMEVLRISRNCGTGQLYGIDRIHADPELGLTLFAFGEGLAIKLGFKDYESKYSRLLDMISYVRWTDQGLNIERIDLSDLDRMVIKPSGGGAFLGVSYQKGALPIF